MKEVITGIICFVVGIVGIVVIFFSVYAFVGFLSFLFSDPFNWVNDQNIEVYTKWDRCVDDTNKIWDNINDTVGATYATQDQPSLNAREFMDYCLKNNPEGNPPL